ncbi:hypothetical protein GCM10020000_44530 [Streptomyces olivoverticillatus]
MLAVALMLAVGLVRALGGGLPHANVHAQGALDLGTPGQGWLYGASLFMVLRAFANGGSSLTGLEAISNSVSAFRRPQGTNARRTLTVMSCVLGTMVLGVSALAHFTHAIPYVDGNPTVIAQEAHLVFGNGWLGTAGLVYVQLATALILYTGANTPFTGFPFLASFVAEDRFLPRQLTRRGHRLAFSNGIISLTVVSLALLLVTRGSVDRLVALYAIGVFTGFTMAAAGMTAHYLRQPGERHRHWKAGVNLVAAVASALVVLIFAVTKFTEGAWLVVMVFPLGGVGADPHQPAVPAGGGGAGARPLPGERPHWRRHLVYVLVDAFDLATVKALSYAHELRADEVRALHFVIDEARAKRLARLWEESTGTGDVPLDLIDCPDRRLRHTVATIAARITADGATALTLLIPRRTYSTPLGWLLHRNMGEEMAKTLEHLPNVAVTILPFDVTKAIEQLQAQARAARSRTPS